MDDVVVMAPRKRSNTLPGTFTVPAAAAAAADDDDDDDDDEPVQPDDDCHIADNDGLLLYARLPLRCHMHSFTLTCAHFKHIQLINLLLVFAPFRLRGVMALFACLYHMFLHLSFFLHFFLICFLTYRFL